LKRAGCVCGAARRDLAKGEAHHARQIHKRDPVERKLKRLLAGFPFAPFAEVIAATAGR